MIYVLYRSNSVESYLFEGANVHRLSNRDVILWVTDLRQMQDNSLLLKHSWERVTN